MNTERERTAFEARLSTKPDGGDVVQEFIDATDALLESQERKTWTSGYVKEMTVGERMAVAARWRKARAALIGQPAASVELSDLAHEIWAAAQLTPDEGIEVGVARIQALLSRYGRPAGDVQSVDAQGTNAAIAAIQFALEADDGLTWLRCWNEGDFDACRNEWPETPEECFIGADPLHPSTRAALAVNRADDGMRWPSDFPMKHEGDKK